MRDRKTVVSAGCSNHVERESPGLSPWRRLLHYLEVTHLPASLLIPCPPPVSAPPVPSPHHGFRAMGCGSVWCRGLWLRGEVILISNTGSRRYLEREAPNHEEAGGCAAFLGLRAHWSSGCGDFSLLFLPLPL